MTTTRLTDRKRSAIVQAAIAEFRANGFDATSMDRVAATAGVSKRTVYNHFPSKDDLFAQILEELWDCTAATAPASYCADRPLRGQLMDLLRQKMGLLRDPYFLDLARVAIAEAIHTPERARSMVAKLSQKEEGAAALLRAAQADGKLKPGDPAFMANVLQGQLKTFAFWPQVAMGQPALDAAQEAAIVETAIDMFLCYWGK
ncbi:TetR/AcrR family transcriptional regulator [Pseudoduganella lutea]|uniref:TetR/AcrR family transcriptional regulator n=1 Tax=Pseudoduganella lutea TaxID=321985 RepID=A0A4P6KWQ9_9BURK|nr:TetR/AcrR family transcriptional regulator [Pseudoduganella lutea]QBE63581.1 TetR/AcrR family transcriptional regulator [Pseudoduganella lutea]